LICKSLLHKHGIHDTAATPANSSKTYEEFPWRCGAVLFSLAQQ